MLQKLEIHLCEAGPLCLFIDVKIDLFEGLIVGDSVRLEVEDAMLDKFAKGDRVLISLRDLNLELVGDKFHEGLD